MEKFRIYGNTYRPLNAVYWTPFRLTYAKRWKLANTYISCLSLGFHGANVDDIIRDNGCNELASGLEKTSSYTLFRS